MFQGDLHRQHKGNCCFSKFCESTQKSLSYNLICIHEVKFRIIFQALHNHNFQSSDRASNKLHTITQPQLTAPAEWFKYSSQFVSSIINIFCSPIDPCQCHTKLDVCEISKCRTYSCPCAQEQETWGFLFPALHGGQWSASCHGHFTTNERSLKYPVNKRLGDSQTQPG